MKKEKKGFTLVELVIVIAIIALLMVIAVPSILLVSNKLNQKTYDTRVKLILAAAEMYADEHYSVLFGDGNLKTYIKVIDLVPTYVESDETTYDPVTGAAIYNVIDPRDKSSMNEKNIWLTRKNAKIIATLEDDSLAGSGGAGAPSGGGNQTPEDAFDFSNGNIIVVAYLNDVLHTTKAGDGFPFPSDTTFNATKSRCNGGSALAVRSEGGVYKATVSNIKKQTICMLYFVSSSNNGGNTSDTKTITLVAENGNISTSNPQTVAVGSSATFSLTPKEGYSLTDAVVNCAKGTTAKIQGGVVTISGVTQDDTCTVLLATSDIDGGMDNNEPEGQ